MTSDSGAFYFGAASTNNDWTSPQNDALWQDAAKTLFDPCPALWRVPRGGLAVLNPWSAFTSINGPLEGTESTMGRHFDHTVVFGASSSWHPAVGVRFNVHGRMEWVGSNAHSWTSTGDGGLSFRYFYNQENVDNGQISRSRGNSVRCIRE